MIAFLLGGFFLSIPASRLGDLPRPKHSKALRREQRLLL
jgi:hypothetical protein